MEFKIWGMGLLDVVTCFAYKTPDGFESHILHQRMPGLRKLYGVIGSTPSSDGVMGSNPSIDSEKRGLIIL